jgi:hypothetical protein
MNQDRKRKMTMAWNPLRCHLVDVLPKGRILNADSCRDNIVRALIPLLPEAAGRKLLLHADNARPRAAHKCGTFRADNYCGSPHPPLSINLKPSDFFILRYLTNPLQEIFFPSQEEFLTGITPILCEILAETSQPVFEHWMNGLELWNVCLIRNIQSVDIS